jgi:fumarate hydratase subunit beta
MKKIQLPLTEYTIRELKTGDEVLLSGTVLTGRDAAHKRMIALLEKGEALPVSLRGEVIYYVGPAPARPGYAVGPAGPTSSYRMDSYTPPLLAMKEYGAVYFGAVGGSAVLISKSIISSEVVAYPDLGTEAIHRFIIKDFPAVVAVDARGHNLYEEGPKLYKQTQL